MWIIRKRIKKGSKEPAAYLVDDMLNFTPDQGQARKFTLAADGMCYIDSHLHSIRDVLELVTVDVPEDAVAV